MEFKLKGSASATGHFSETIVAVVPSHWTAEAAPTRSHASQLLNEQYMAAARVRGVAVLAIGCLAAEARKKCRRQRPNASSRVARGEATSPRPGGVSAPQTYYELLGVHPSADNSAIKHAYHSKMKACHPDVCGEEGCEMTMMLNEAYTLLQEPETRRAYDLTLPRPDEDHCQAEEEDDGNDLLPVWQYKPATKEDRGLEKPKWKNRPRSRSHYSQVPHHDRGSKWEAQQFLYVNPFSCIACRNCTDVAPKTFGWDHLTGRARVWQQWGDSEEYCDYSVMSCPVDCIHWVGREELQALEYVTATAIYDTGGQLPCPMGMRNGLAVGGVEDPFELADKFLRTLSKKRKSAREKVKKATGQVLQRIRLRIQEAFQQLPPAVRQLAWPRWFALKP
jgi:ferredoxin